MAMSKTDFKNAFREAVSSEFAHIPTDENSIDFTFSERFNKRMAKLIKSQKKVYYNFINTAYKRVAIICIVLLTMLTTACSVKAIREPIVNFFTEVYESFTRYFFDGDIADTITKEYFISDLPDEYIETDKIVSEAAITTVYENNNGDRIKFRQQITLNGEHTFDSENKEKLVKEIDGLTIDFYVEDMIINAIWVKDEYSFRLTTYGAISVDEIELMIKSIQ